MIPLDCFLWDFWIITAYDPAQEQLSGLGDRMNVIFETCNCCWRTETIDF